LRPASEPHTVDPTENYPIAGVYGFGRGMLKRAAIAGQELAAQQLYRVKSGQFIYSRLKSFEGAFAIVSHDVDGYFVSNEFPTFDAVTTRIEPGYLGWFFKQKRVWQALASDNKGIGARRERLHPDRLLAHEIPLPPLVEQRRVVARIEAIAAKLDEARSLRSQSLHAAEVIFGQVLSHIFETASASWTITQVNEVAGSLDAGWSPQCEEVPATDAEWGVLKTTSVQWAQFWPHENKRLPPSAIPRPELAVKKGDVLVTRAGPMKRVGVPATVREDHPRLMISDKLMRIRTDRQLIDPRFLEYALSSKSAQNHLVARKTGLADAQVNISQAILRSTPIAYPALEEQRGIVAKLDELQARVSAIKALQTDTAAEMEAMMPAVLDKAFKGEL